MTSKPIEYCYHDSHTGNRSPEQSRQRFCDMAGPKGLDTAFAIFENLGTLDTQKKLGLTVSENDVPIDATKEYFVRLLEDDQEFLCEAMDFGTNLGGLLLRRCLWNQEGLPGFRIQTGSALPAAPPPNTAIFTSATLISYRDIGRKLKILRKEFAFGALDVASQIVLAYVGQVRKGKWAHGGVQFEKEKSEKN